jgi:uncharacterized iron-regulated membrane protein
MTVWKGWVLHPQRLWLRRCVFQVHLWSGIGLGAYILMISVTGSVLVYRNELFDVSERVLQATSWLLDLHDNLLAGASGRTVNGFGAIAVLVLAFSGLVIWWPGAHAWRRSLTLPRGLSARRTVWHLHSMVGFWTLGIILMIGLSGAYLGFPEQFQALADFLDPPRDGGGDRITDRLLYWLAYLHFGRIYGIGIPCSGPGLCDQATKATWALFGLSPAFMFVTGAIVWWNRVLRPQWQALGRRPERVAG